MSALLPVINHLIRQNPEHQSSLAHFAGRTLCINLSGLRIKACIGSSGFLEPTAEEADTEITFRNSAVQKILQGGKPGVGDIEIDGDLMLGMSLLPILGGLRYDAGDDLNRIFGEAAAENISARAAAIGDTVKPAKASPNKSANLSANRNLPFPTKPLSPHGWRKWTNCATTSPA